MRRTALSTALLTVLAVGVVGAQNCTTTGPSSRPFAAGSLVIPMDNCYQKRDGSSAPGGQTTACNSAADDGVFRAYGLVYFLLKHNITVYWAIEGASAKTAVTSADVTVPAGPNPLVRKLNWNTFAFDTFGFPSGQELKYVGGPYIIDSADAATVKNLLQNDPDFASFRSQKFVDVHEVENGFTANQVRPLTGPPPKIAILAINPQPYHKTSLDVMYRYAVAAGLDNPSCNPSNGDCYGGLGPSCDATVVQKYLADTLCARDSSNNCPSSSVCSSCAPNWVSPNITNAKFNPPGTPGKAFDILCDGDFIPPAGGTYADTYLAQGDYKLLWVPHWDTAKVDPTGTANQAQLDLKAQLQTIASFVNAGNNLFAECYGIMAMEGVAGENVVAPNGTEHLLGVPATRFQTSGGIFNWNGPSDPPWSDTSLLLPAEPNLQVGDFQYTVVSGAITTYHPGNAAGASHYLDGVDRLILATTPAISGTCSPACTNGFTCQGGTCKPPSWDASSSFQVAGPDGVRRGTVAYLGGHDYSPPVTGTGGQTAGTRIVLNTLFNLGFACADPKDGSGQPVTCTTGGLGACSLGVLKCASGGGMQCVPSQASSAEVCDGVDNDCNGLIDDGPEGSVCNPSVCDSGTTRPCYSGPAGTAGTGVCAAGEQLCQGAFWGACGDGALPDEKLPSPEVCNLKDDDCNGLVDDGNLCGAGMTCSATYGVCLPTSCNSENARCPDGFLCNSGNCQAKPCPTNPCGAGQVCRSNVCVDPCASVTCGQGSSCSGGLCLAGGCALTGCDPGLVCVNGNCVDDPCAGTSCPMGTFCRLGDCVRSCAYVTCPSGKECSADGFCEGTCGAGCESGQMCSNGTCVADPCAGVVCGAGQVCEAGWCVDDPCMHVTCAVGSCSGGQCVNGGVSTFQQNLVASAGAAAGGGGCASTGAGGLVSLAGLALLLAVRRRVRRPAAARASGAMAMTLAVLLAGAVATGCSKSSSGGPTTCQNGQTACGSSCVDTTSARENCGECGRACLTGFVCVASGCSIDTPNPFVRSVVPSTVGAGSQVTLKLAVDDLRSGAKLRITAPGVNQELDIANPTTDPSVVVDFSGVSTGTAQLRAVNYLSPNRFVSNAVPISIVDAFLLRGVLPAGARQDGAPLSLTLSGAGFAQGAVASLKASGGAPVLLETVFVSSTELTVNGVAPGNLAVGAYDLTVTNPGNVTTNALKFTVTEGAPTLSSVTPVCNVVNSQLNGSATGSNFYSSSVVRVSGGSIVDSPLTTTCLSGTDALGRCAGGQVRVTGDLAGVPAGTYDVVVVNPGSPNALRSSPPITVQVQSSCP